MREISNEIRNASIININNWRETYKTRRIVILDRFGVTKGFKNRISLKKLLLQFSLSPTKNSQKLFTNSVSALKRKSEPLTILNTSCFIPDRFHCTVPEDDHINGKDKINITTISCSIIITIIIIIIIRIIICPVRLLRVTNDLMLSLT